MALSFHKDHNQVGCLEAQAGFEQIVGFLSRSHLRYALITSPTIYRSTIKSFWHNASVITLDSGEVQIHALVDGHTRIVSESLLRSSLQLNDSDGINLLTNTEIFDGLSTMGYENDGTFVFHKNSFLSSGNSSFILFCIV